jgi:hypothetical protein
VEAEVSGAEEYKPDDAENENREPSRHGEQRENRWTAFALARLAWGFDNTTLLLGCHGDLVFSALNSFNASSQKLFRAQCRSGPLPAF